MSVSDEILLIEFILAGIHREKKIKKHLKLGYISISITFIGKTILVMEFLISFELLKIHYFWSSVQVLRNKTHAIIQTPRVTALLLAS